MPDLAGQSASAAAPALDIEKLKADLLTSISTQVDQRVAGFQRIISTREREIEALRKENLEFKTAGLSEDERGQLLVAQRDEEIKKLQAQLEMRDLGSRYGDEMPYFERLLAASNTEEQLAVMREFGARGTAAAAPATPATTPVPASDPNNPARQDQFTDDGVAMTDELADRILRTGSVQADITQPGWRSRA